MAYTKGIFGDLAHNSYIDSAAPSFDNQRWWSAGSTETRFQMEKIRHEELARKAEREHLGAMNSRSVQKAMEALGNERADRIKAESELQKLKEDFEKKLQFDRKESEKRNAQEAQEKRSKLSFWRRHPWEDKEMERFTDARCGKDGNKKTPLQRLWKNHVTFTNDNGVCIDENHAGSWRNCLN